MKTQCFKIHYRFYKFFFFPIFGISNNQISYIFQLKHLSTKNTCLNFIKNSLNQKNKDFTENSIGNFLFCFFN